MLLTPTHGVVSQIGIAVITIESGHIQKRPVASKCLELRSLYSVSVVLLRVQRVSECEGDGGILGITAQKRITYGILLTPLYSSTQQKILPIWMHFRSNIASDIPLKVKSQNDTCEEFVLRKTKHGNLQRLCFCLYLLRKFITQH